MEFRIYFQSAGPTKSYIYYIQCLHVIRNSFRSSLNGYYPPFSTPEHGISTQEHPTPERFWPTPEQKKFSRCAQLIFVLGLMKFYGTPLPLLNSTGFERISARNCVFNQIMQGHLCQLSVSNTNNNLSSVFSYKLTLLCFGWRLLCCICDWGKTNFFIIWSHESLTLELKLSDNLETGTCTVSW